ncbi:DUF2971 domain-containing protein [Sphingopyxis witflariensis]|uniref:DUF2971 domain-containing protein n=1 Tax=Sphingopyxis witflariensis TaxID=173675 RepID=A0A246JYK8_9SPHN|nr:DUF2971 domain-containing protein [Sphingopyxis witflariensis]OWQ98252.1 hypothetical protein CDQ91_06970 [Sphingopyxis witflariensis]
MRNDGTLRLYKYRNLLGEFGRASIEQAISGNKLFWQSPSSFNDPFDSLPVLYFGDNESQRKQFRGRAAAAVYGGPRVERRKREREMRAVPPLQMEKALRDQWPQWLRDSAATCFSEVPDHPLMWGHYADSHKGVCLIFDEIANDKIQWFGFPVEYKEERPRVNLTKFNNPEIMMSALFHKSAHWSYEREHRMIEWAKPPGYRAFPPQALVGIILGASISDDDEAFVRGLLAKRPALEVYRTAIDAVEFKLNIIREE